MAVPKKVLEGIHEAFIHHTNEASGGRTFSVKSSSQKLSERLRCLRERLNMSQKEFALQFGIPLRTLQKWEQNERTPEGPARAYLTTIERIPEAVIAALQSDRLEKLTESKTS
jgi:putative transcriptional regulator